MDGSDAKLLLDVEGNVVLAMSFSLGTPAGSNAGKICYKVNEYRSRTSSLNSRIECLTMRSDGMTSESRPTLIKQIHDEKMSLPSALAQFDSQILWSLPNKMYVSS
ncbi:hypothetical protein Ciccas_012099 [Cichlidogyrus casuarinus]|uniref:Uncharacterized protein n=1 Tax=Cichlidogyrus casuarinus TaxID=1844966 RepID=A0ABD2PQ39_9PLAT